MTRNKNSASSARGTLLMLEKEKSGLPITKKFAIPKSTKNKIPERGDIPSISKKRGTKPAKPKNQSASIKKAVARTATDPKNIKHFMNISCPVPIKLSGICRMKNFTCDDETH